MASISASELAARLLDNCLAGRGWDPDDVTALTAAALDGDEYLASLASKALFSGLAEPLADLFDPRLASEYARLFSRVFSQALPEFGPAQMEEHYAGASQVRQAPDNPSRVVVLSRVTLGADVAITSLFLNAAKRRYPSSEIVFAGTMKAWELFERDPRLRHCRIEYGRSATLRSRLACFATLREVCQEPGTILLDPDSRLSQLGLLPLCPASSHFLFESRAAGGERMDPLPVLASEWLERTLGIGDAEPYLHPKYTAGFGNTHVITASFGVGENPAKHPGRLFEHGIAAHLAGLPSQVIIDAGAPESDEEERVRQAVAAAGERGARIGIHSGPFASFAAMVAESNLYFGYDSAGQHVAAAMGVPLVTVFKGFVNERMLARWTPCGPGPVTVLRADRFASEDELLAAAERALTL